MANKKSHKKRRINKKQKQLAKRYLLAAALIAVAFVLLLGFLWRREKNQKSEKDSSISQEGEPDIDVQLLTVNEYSRPGIALKQVNGIVIHYTANPGSTAQDNRNYFENLKDSHQTKVSSHFVIGLDGEIIQCIPSSEISYASNDRNTDTISIECCHPDETGKFNDATYQSLLKLTAFLCRKFSLSSEDVIRHYDITGKNCPKYFVEHEDAWTEFLAEVKDNLNS